MDQDFIATQLLPFLAGCTLQRTPGDLEALDSLRARMAAANQSCNLTRVTAEHAYWIKHVADSLSIGMVHPELLHEPLCVADIGFGGGFPILALAWANPKLRLIGIERRPRKAEFVAAAASALGFANVTVRACQAREAALTHALRGRCDAVVARAVADCATLLKHTRSLLRPAASSRMIFYKTPHSIARELPEAEREAEKFGFSLEVSPRIDLPYGAGVRQFITFHAASSAG